MPKKSVAPQEIFITKNNAKKMVDAFGRLKKRLAKLEDEEQNYRQAFIKYAQPQVMGVVYKVDINFEITVTRFEVKRFCDENPGVAKLYSVTTPDNIRVEVKNIK